MRVVLDSNILARPALSSTGPATEVLRRMKQPDHVLIVSSFILAELDRILRYPRLQRLHNFDNEKIVRFVENVKQAAVLLDPTTEEVLSIVKADPDDDHIIATAVIANAEVICTWDKHFSAPEVRTYCAQRGIEIVDDSELLQRMRKAEAE